MTQLLTAKSMFRDRDLFVHDGSKLRRIHLPVSVQLVFFAALLALVGLSAYGLARLTVSAPAASQDISTIAAATELRTNRIEQRQAILVALMAGENVDPLAMAATTELGELPDQLETPLARVEAAQQKQAILASKALDARYRMAAMELRKLGLTPARLGGGVGGPYEPATSADPTFKQLFMSWKKLDNLHDGAIAVPVDMPVRTASFTSGYGVRSDPFRGNNAMHAGIDLAGPVGTPIHATADGIITEAGWSNGGYGNLIKIDHGRGIETRYAHLSGFDVRRGDRVTRGQLIGRMGSTGRSTGSHLHYEVRIDGRAVNPVPFMKSTDYLVAMQRRANGAPMHALGGPTSSPGR